MQTKTLVKICYLITLKYGLYEIWESNGYQRNFCKTKRIPKTPSIKINKHNISNINKKSSNLLKNITWKLNITSNLADLEIGTIVFRNVKAIALWKHHNLLLNVFYLIFGLFKVNDFNGNHLLCSSVNSFENLPKGSLTNAFLASKDRFRVNLCLKNKAAAYRKTVIILTLWPFKKLNAERANNTKHCYRA